jgi:hypothetical protein
MGKEDVTGSNWISALLLLKASFLPKLPKLKLTNYTRNNLANSSS